MSQQSTEKKSVPWLLMGLGLLIPIFIDQQHAEIAKKFEKQKNTESAIKSE